MNAEHFSNVRQKYNEIRELLQVNGIDEELQESEHARCMQLQVIRSMQYIMFNLTSLMCL